MAFFVSLKKWLSAPNLDQSSQCKCAYEHMFELYLAISHCEYIMHRYLNYKKVMLSLLGMMLPVSMLHAQDEWFDLSLAELMEIEVLSSASVTPSSEQLQPAAVTRITQKMIKHSGAKNLMSLLEVYVPNLHYLPHHWEASHIGLRGIIGDREDKYLLLVNGKVMNEGTHLGVMSERDFPMLNDIRRIDVIRGSGSVVYGPGAISLVINIQTESFSHHSQPSVTASLGAVGEYASIEIKNSFKIAEQHGFYAYAGFSYGNGNNDSDVIYGLSGTTPWGETINGGETNSQIYQPNVNDYYRDQPKIKLHVDYQYHNWNAWVRYTRGGEKLTWSHKLLYDGNNGLLDSDAEKTDQQPHSVGYQQFSAALDHKRLITDNLHLETRLSYDITDAERILFDSFNDDKLPETHREDKAFVRTLLNWQPSTYHSLATGIEFQYQRWGLKSIGYPDLPANSFVLGEMDAWSTYSYSALIEHQWKIDNTFTSFLGARLDKDKYTDTMFSPRWSLVYAPSSVDTYKLIASKSVRKNNAEELRQQHLAGETGDPEEINTLEFIASKKIDKQLITLTGFYNDYSILGINVDTLRSESVANMKFAGVEFEWSLSNDNWTFFTNHGYTKLIDLDAETSQKISASANDYGDDISQWSNHISKVSAHYQLNNRNSIYSSLRVFWGYDGSQDFIDLTNDLRADSVDGDSSSTALTDPGYSDSADAAAYLDFGWIYNMSQDQSIELRGYDLLGLIDKKYNKRIYVINVGNYQQQAASVSIKYTLTY